MIDALTMLLMIQQRRSGNGLTIRNTDFTIAQVKMYEEAECSEMTRN